VLARKRRIEGDKREELMRRSSFCTTVLVFAVFVWSASPSAGQGTAANARAQLKQEVSQLQQNPDDRDLREKIIRLALTLKPAPTVPDEAAELVGAGKFAMKQAKTKDEFADAAKKFQDASNLAPWAADIYYDLGVAQQGAGRYDEAIKNFKLYLLAAPDATDREAAMEHIGAAKYAAEHPPSAQSAVASSSPPPTPPPLPPTPEEQEKKFVESLDGACFIYSNPYDHYRREALMVRRGWVWRASECIDHGQRCGWTDVQEWCRFSGLTCHYDIETVSLSADGSSMTTSNRWYTRIHARADGCPRDF
jgi:hypothetical protein